MESNITKLPQMRTRHEFYRLLKETDPHTAVTPHMIYQKIRSGEWPTVTVGKKNLLNVEQVMTMLSNPQPKTMKQEAVIPFGKIRRQGEK